MSKKHPRMLLFPLIISLFIGLFFLTGCVPDPEVAPFPEPTRDPILEASIIHELEGMDPDAVPLYLEATEIMDQGEYLEALNLYGQLADLVPQFPTVYRRLCYVESTQGNTAAAVEFGRIAVELDPNAYNQSALAMALIGEQTPQASREAFNLAVEAHEKLPDDPSTVETLVITSWMAFEEGVLRESNQRLVELMPGHPLGHYLAGILAASDGKWFKAERELIMAQKLGIPPEIIQEVMDSGLAWNLNLLRSIFWGAVAIGFWLIGLGILYLAGNFLSKSTIETLKNEEKHLSYKISKREKQIRSAYRLVIRILTIYFYISIPFVILLILVLGGAVYYIFALIGVIPIYIALGLAFILLISLVIMLRSLFRRVKEQPPGVKLDRDRVPELWSLNDAMAKALQVRTVDAIYLSPDPVIAVNESGSMVRKMRGAGERNLILGMGILRGLTVGQFAAVLAHEYGHFSNQDTAGGNLAGRVYVSLEEMAVRLIQGSAALPFNPVWLFVSVYRRIYLRATLGAKRLQEVLADRYAALSVGSELLVSGLISIVKEGIRFGLKANRELKRAIEAKVGISNLYDLPMTEELEAELEEEYKKRLDAETSEYDSHPALQQRIDRILSYRAQNKWIHKGDEPLLTLIPGAEELQMKMTKEITDQIPGL